MERSRSGHPGKTAGRGKGKAKKVDQDKSGGKSKGIKATNAEGKASYSATKKMHASDSLQPVQFSNAKDIQKTRKLSTSLKKEEANKDILQNIFLSYKADDTDTGLGRTQEFILESVKSESCICLICIESITVNESVWSCKVCFCMFHFSCIQKWSKDNIYYQSLSLNDNSSQDQLKWSCPKCRQEYSQKDQPSQYLCFCGKEEDPPYDPWLLPHSCGQTCGKSLQPPCGHKCLLLCHPGPCPPCPKIVQNHCFCKKSGPITRRCSARNWSCGHLCGCLLLCKQHYCEQPCHGGDCALCSKESQQNCLCGQETKLSLCASPKWHCKRVCEKPLGCKNHLCNIVCHDGECPPCPKTGPRPCPCGKSVMDLPCTKDIPPCGDTCDKLLECGIHHCSNRCHSGPCGSCLQMRIMKCRCGQREKSMPCCKEYTCEIKCKRYRDCRRHTCNHRCCDGNCPPCELPCKRQLKCGNHKCNSRCHQGPCFPCPEVATITCKCGATKLTVPCARMKFTKPPLCKALCKTPPECHHLQQEKHVCHFGPCPPCSQICSKTLTECDHTCPAYCHTVVLKKISTEKRAGPWECPVPRVEVVCEPCPPCVVPIPLKCFGTHEIQSFPCSEVRPWSCGRLCGRQLLCSNHTCSVECHTVTNAPSAFEAGDTCQVCEEPCTKARPEGCSHPCLLPCHTGPCPPCQQRIRLHCHCHLSTLYIVCDEWINADADERENMLSCQNRCPKIISCGHRCPLKCHLGNCAGVDTCKKRITIRCSCKRLKREVLCHAKTKGDVIIECDDICKKILEKEREAQLAESEKKKMEEISQQIQEIEEFQRKMERKKKKHKKNREIIEHYSWCDKYYYFSAFGAVVALVAFIYFVTFTKS